MKDFIYLGSSINTDNNSSLAIRSRITLANRYYFGLRKQLSKSALDEMQTKYKIANLVLKLTLFKVRLRCNGRGNKSLIMVPILGPLLYRIEYSYFSNSSRPNHFDRSTNLRMALILVATISNKLLRM